MRPNGDACCGGNSDGVYGGYPKSFYDEDLYPYEEGSTGCGAQTIKGCRTSKSKEVLKVVDYEAVCALPCFDD